MISADVVNRAIQLIGDNQPAVTGTGTYPDPSFDLTPAGLAAQACYVGVVNTVGRQFGWDFSRRHVLLTLTGGTPESPWIYEYFYPANGIQVRQLIPLGVDPLNPLPVRWVVANDSFGAGNVKVILTVVPVTTAVFSNQVDENLWDAGFTEAVVRLLSDYLAMALAGRPETSRMALENAGMFTSASMERVDN